MRVVARGTGCTDDRLDNDVQRPRGIHAATGEGGPVCACGGKGHLEALASRTAIVRDIVIAIEKGRVILEGPLDHFRETYRRITLVFDDPPPPEAFRRDGVDQVIVRGRTISILASRNVDEIAALGPLLAAKSVEVQPVGLKELFLEKVKEDRANS